MTSTARSAARPSPVFRECDGAPWPSDDELEMDAAWAALRQSAAVERYDDPDRGAVARSRVTSSAASDAWIDDEPFDDAWIDDACIDAQRSVLDEVVSDIDARLGHLEIVAAQRQRATAHEYRLIASILARAAADPTPWVGPDPTRDPAWSDPRGRRTAAVRRDRVDIAQRAAVAEIAVRLHLSEQTVRLRAARAETLQDRCPQMWRAFADGRVSERHAIETARLAGSLPGVGEIVDPDADASVLPGDAPPPGSADAVTVPSGIRPVDETRSEPADTDTGADPVAGAVAAAVANTCTVADGGSVADGGADTDSATDHGAAADLEDGRADPATAVWRAFDSAVREPAADLVPAKFAVAARAIRERVHAESLERRHRRAAEDRGVWVTAEMDGMASLNALLPADRARGMMARIDRIARHLRVAPDEDRTLAQLRADALSDLVVSPGPSPIESVVHVDADADSMLDTSSSTLADGAGTTNAGEPRVHRDGDGPPGGDRRAGGDRPPGGNRPPGTDATTTPTTARDVLSRRTTSSDRPFPPASRPTVIVTIPVLTLLGQDTAPPILDGYGPIDLDTARRLACEATSWVRLLTHPIDGTPLTLDRKTYRVPVALRRWLGITSPTCVFPGCGRAAADCDVDHRRAWAEGGTTDDDNLDPTCRHHHRLKHESGWMPSSSPGTGLTWLSPLGGSYGTDPPPF